jgi:cytochrome c oxidase assembly protein subunit 11
LNRNTKLALTLATLFFGMVMLTMASVPIYRVFCKLTGYGGTTQVASTTSNDQGTKTYKVRFDSNVDKDLPWKFESKQTDITVKTGQNAIAFYYAENLSSQPIIGTAVYNVTPHSAAKYFVKIECFCFQEQLLNPGQKVLMPVTFYLDHSIEKDPELKGLDTVTLSYSFYRVAEK